MSLIKINERKLEAIALVTIGVIFLFSITMEEFRRELILFSILLFFLLHIYFIFKSDKIDYSLMFALSSLYLIGGIFKIQHWEGAGMIFGIGIIASTIGYSFLLFRSSISLKKDLGKHVWLVYMLILLILLPVVLRFFKIWIGGNRDNLNWISLATLGVAFHIFQLKINYTKKGIPVSFRYLIILIIIYAGMNITAQTSGMI